MIRNLAPIAFGLFALIFMGCTTVSSRSQPTVDTLIITNRATTNISEVVLRVPNTGRVISTNMILQGTDYSLKFPVTTAENNPSFISWNQNSTTFTEQLVAENAEKFINNKELNAFKVYVDIFDNGRVKVYLK